jgi:hypothetical protein
MEDTMADRFGRMDAGRSAHDLGATPRQARWSAAIIAAIVVALGLAFYGISAKQSGPKLANPPAVTAAPAPATGVPPPPPQTTTGQAAPSAAPETTGRGGTSPAAPR